MHPLLPSGNFQMCSTDHTRSFLLIQWPSCIQPDPHPHPTVVPACKAVTVSCIEGVRERKKLWWKKTTRKVSDPIRWLKFLLKGDLNLFGDGRTTQPITLPLAHTRGVNLKSRQIQTNHEIHTANFDMVRWSSKLQETPKAHNLDLSKGCSNAARLGVQRDRNQPNQQSLDTTDSF